MLTAKNASRTKNYGFVKWWISKLLQMLM